MNATIEFQKQPENKTIIVKHSYDQPLEKIWNAFTKTEILEKWWAPKPYKAVVISNEFEEGRTLHYYMVSPTGEKHYCIGEFLAIDPMKSYEMLDQFCDEEGVIDTALPAMKWRNTFSFQNGQTTVVNTLTFEKEEDMAATIKMGFEEGYKTALNQLHDLL